MDNDKKKQEIIDVIKGIDFIKPEDIPSIDLYMDQLTTFMEEQLGGNRRNNEDKIMTKTMINNYTKNNLLPSPNKKRYSKEHLILLIYIYYLKNLLSITDIQTLLMPMIDNHYQSSEDKLNISDIYSKLYQFQHDTYDDLIESVIQTNDKASQMYDQDTEPYLHSMSVISLLSADIYVKKKYIEHLIDDMNKKQKAEREKLEKAKIAERTKAEKAKAAEKAKVEKAKAAEKVKAEKAKAAEKVKAEKAKAAEKAKVEKAKAEKDKNADT
ncbi:MAG: DUF1836 domain-containing protein [Coprococcus sp.]|nr:DUF1836 domain-containing protein [Coprococcus sp.]